VKKGKLTNSNNYSYYIQLPDGAKDLQVLESVKKGGDAERMGDINSGKVFAFEPKLRINKVRSIDFFMLKIDSPFRNEYSGTIDNI
jgi:hypothetical protein